MVICSAAFCPEGFRVYWEFKYLRMNFAMASASYLNLLVDPVMGVKYKPRSPFTFFTGFQQLNFCCRLNVLGYTLLVRLPEPYLQKTRCAMEKCEHVDATNGTLGDLDEHCK